MSDDDTLVALGYDLDFANWHMCHPDRAISASRVDDLRYFRAELPKFSDRIVLEGILRNEGMVRFTDKFSNSLADVIHAYLNKRAHDVLNEED